MPRSYDPRFLNHHPVLDSFGLPLEVVGKSITHVHEVLDSIDAKLLEGADERLSELVELANLSAIIGNLYRGAVVKTSGGRFAANAPHTYPDLLGKAEGTADIEIKVALEANKPKGHLIKPGPHLTVRYVLVDAAGVYSRGKKTRGKVAWIWEVRIGALENGHFNFSNTDGDSGKTAVINRAGMEALHIVYCDPERCPVVSLTKKYRPSQQPNQTETPHR